LVATAIKVNHPREVSKRAISLKTAIENDNSICYHFFDMKIKHRKTLTDLFTKPTMVGIRFFDIEGLIVACPHLA
jgi:hypothetical protein